jgi:hypothetical protein
LVGQIKKPVFLKNMAFFLDIGDKAFLLAVLSVPGVAIFRIAERKPVPSHGVYFIKIKLAQIRKRDKRIIDALSEVCALGTIITLEYSWSVLPNERNFKRLRMYVQVLRNKLEKEFPSTRPYFSLT